MLINSVILALIYIYTIIIINNPYEQKKYHTENSPLLLIWSWMQLSLALFFMFHLFIIMENFTTKMVYYYVIFLMVHVFSYTATLDGRKYAPFTESLKLGIGVVLLSFQGFSWYGSGDIIALGLSLYLLSSLFLSYYFLRESQSINSSDYKLFLE